MDVNNPTKVSLNSIVPAGTFDSDEITINLLDDSGAVVRGWTWINWGGDSGDVECWSEDGSGEIAENETFTVGQAFWVQGSSEEQGIQSAGKVGSNDVTFQLRNGYTIAGNPFPTTIALDDIVPTGDVVSDDITINLLDDSGAVLRGWTWINWGGESGDLECWSEDGAGEKAEGVTFAPGQGLWIQAGSDAEYVQFVAPEL